MGAWIWRKLLPHLAYPALCVEGRADTARCPDFRTVTVTDCVDHLVAETNRSGFGKIVLVGHSGAGCLIPLAAGRSGKRVRHLVFISANIPPQGRRTVDVMPLFMKWAHLLYRPMAMYFVAVRKRAAMRGTSTQPSMAPTA